MAYIQIYHYFHFCPKKTNVKLNQFAFFPAYGRLHTFELFDQLKSNMYFYYLYWKKRLCAYFQ